MRVTWRGGEERAEFGRCVVVGGKVPTYHSGLAVVAQGASDSGFRLGGIQLRLASTLRKTSKL